MSRSALITVALIVFALVGGAMLLNRTPPAAALSNTYGISPGFIPLSMYTRGLNPAFSTGDSSP